MSQSTSSSTTPLVDKGKFGLAHHENVNFRASGYSIYSSTSRRRRLYLPCVKSWVQQRNVYQAQFQGLRSIPSRLSNGYTPAQSFIALSSAQDASNSFLHSALYGVSVSCNSYQTHNNHLILHSRRGIIRTICRHILTFKLRHHISQIPWDRDSNTEQSAITYCFWVFVPDSSRHYDKRQRN